MDIRHRLLPLAIILTAFLGTSGCSDSAERFSDLTGEAASDTPLPDEIRDHGLDLDSLRWVGDHEGTEFWLSVAAEDTGICLVVYPDDERWVSGCSTGDEVNLSNGGASEYLVRPDSIDPPEGAIQVSHNVFVTER